MKHSFLRHKTGGVRKKIAEQMMKKSVLAINTPTHPFSSKICKFFPAPTNTQPISSKICKFLPRSTTTHPIFSEICKFFPSSTSTHPFFYMHFPCVFSLRPQIPSFFTWHLKPKLGIHFPFTDFFKTNIETLTAHFYQYTHIWFS